MSESTLFDNWVKNYEKDIIRFKDQYPFAGYFSIIDKVQNLIDRNNFKNILDIGIGTGFMMSKIIENRALDIWGLDFSEQMVMKAQTRLESNQILKWNISSSALPKSISNQQFDLILSSFTLHHFNSPTKVQILKNYLELLSNNGIFIIADISFKDRNTMNKIKQKEGKRWDVTEEDGYFIQNDFLRLVEETGHFNYKYEQIAYSTGMYAFSKKNSPD